MYFLNTHNPIYDLFPSNQDGIQQNKSSLLYYQITLKSLKILIYNNSHMIAR